MSGITNLNGIIYEELCLGIVRDESRRIYVEAIARLKARGAEAVILGCTEIGMLIDDCGQPAADLRHHRPARQGPGRRSARLRRLRRRAVFELAQPPVVYRLR